MGKNHHCNNKHDLLLKKKNNQKISVIWSNIDNDQQSVL